MNKPLLLLFILFISCKEDGTFEKLLTKEDKHWVFSYETPTLSDKIDRSTYGFTKFFKNKSVKNYWFIDGKESETIKFEKLNSKLDKWDYNESDSILSFYNYNFKIIRFVSDTIILKDLKSNTNQYFVNFKASK